MFDENSKDNRSKAKEALLEWVRKKTTGYVIYYFHPIFFLFSVNIFLPTNLDFVQYPIFFGEIILSIA